MTKHLQLFTNNNSESTTFCMELFCANGTPGLLVIGMANGEIRCFAPLTLSFVANIPLPALLIQSTLSAPLYPACYALRKVSATTASPVPKLAAVYADRSLIIWDISDVFNILKFRSFLHHSACVWDVHFLDNYYIESSNTQPQSSNADKLPRGTFVTCSADGTIRLWNTDLKAHRRSKFYSQHSKEMLYVFEPESLISIESNERSSVDSSTELLQSISLLSSACPDTESPIRLICTESPRCLAVHPFGHRIGYKLYLFDV